MIFRGAHYDDKECLILALLPVFCIAMSLWAGWLAYDLHVRASRPPEAVKHLGEDSKRCVWELGRVTR